MTPEKNNFRWAEYIFIFSFLVLIVSLSFLALPFSLVLTMFIPLPILIATYRHNTLLGVVIAALASAFFAFFIQESTIVILVVSMSTIGIGLGSALKEKLPYKKVLIIGVVSSLITMSLLGLGLSLATKQPLMEIFDETTKKMIEDVSSMALYSEAEIQRVESMIDTVRLLFPSMIFTGAIFIAGANFIAGSAALKRMKIEDAPALPPLSNWSFPAWLSVAFLILFPLSMLNIFPPLIMVIIQNLYSVANWFLVIQGISIVVYFMKTARIPTWLQVVILFPVYLFSSWFLAFLGALDPWLKYRGRFRVYQNDLKKTKGDREGDK